MTPHSAALRILLLAPLLAGTGSADATRDAGGAAAAEVAIAADSVAPAPAPYLFAWAGDLDRADPDFFAVIDADPGSPGTAGWSPVRCPMRRARRPRGPRARTVPSSRRPPRATRSRGREFSRSGRRPAGCGLRPGRVAARAAGAREAARDGVGRVSDEPAPISWNRHRPLWTSRRALASPAVLKLKCCPVRLAPDRRSRTGRGPRPRS